MGIGYKDSVVVYNRYAKGPEQYFGTRFDNVRVELTQGADQKVSGMEDVSACVVKISNTDLPKPYIAPKAWKRLTEEEKTENFTLDTESQNFFIIVKKEELGIDIDVPAGLVESDSYAGGFFEYVKEQYGYAFSLDTADVYSLIPRFEIGGK
ncbi:MAG: hypothetical protein J1F42_01655 [Lachnospiraceae bacterium]|nr:hypothetical protein [Lachnospiraceae bacterium]